MPNILVLLFSSIESEVWGHSQLQSWVDRLLLKLESPQAWLIDLSLAGSASASKEVLLQGMRTYGVVLSSDAADLMIGFVLLRHIFGSYSIEATRNLIIDIADSYEATIVDPEAVAHLDIDDPTFVLAKGNAQRAMDYLFSDRLIEEQRGLLEDIRNDP